MKNKRSYMVGVIIFGIIYAIYLVATYFNNDFWGDILSPVLAIGAFVSVFLPGTRLDWKNNSGRKSAWIFFSMACLSWGIADLLWLIYKLVIGVDPMENMFILNIYNFTNFFLFIGTVVLCARLLKRWNVIQLLIDTTATAIAVGLTIWIIFFEKSTDFSGFISDTGWLSLFSIFFDIMLVTLIFTTYFSVRKGRVALYVSIMMGGIIVFALTDLIYYHQTLDEAYIPNSLIDGGSMLSFMLLALGAWKKETMKTQDSGLDDYAISASNVGLKRNFYLIIILMLAVGIKEGFVIFDLFVFIIIFFIREVMSFYFQLSIKNEQLLLREKEINNILEEKIKRRTNEIVKKNVELEYAYNHDPITDLFNRNYIMTSLPRLMENLKQTETITFIMLDIDRFKTINDMYGHDIGDIVLVELTKRLKTIEVPKSILARTGGDEFVFVYRDNTSYSKGEEIASKILMLCSTPIEVEQFVFRITASIGISIYPFDANGFNALMVNADIALNHAKTRGKNRWLSFNYELRDSIKRKNQIEMLLKTVNYDEEFELFYQPQFRISDKKLIGAEALVRWNSKALGSISPKEFIPIAEEINVITELGKWILKTAIRQIRMWDDLYGIDFKVGINISPKQLDYVGFVSDFRALLTEYSVPSGFIDIEILESVAMEGEERIKHIYSLFKSLGVSISMDDFGTGYSALSYLKHLPFEKIKIAKELVDAIAIDDYDMQIVKAIVMLAKSLGIMTIAEGVEYQEQFDILESLGCNEIQGYLMGRPVPVEIFEKMFLKK